MRIILSLAMITTAFAAAGCVQQPLRDASVTAPAATVATAGDVVEGTITALERQWVEAIIKKDTATIDRLLADNFAGTSPSAHIYTKDMAIDDLAKGLYAVEAMDMDDLSVNVYGDTAVAFVSQDEKSRYGTSDVSGHYHYTNVWVKKDGVWQAVASHGTRYQTGH